LGWTIAATIALGGLFVILLAALLVFRTTPLITRRFEALADRLNRLSKGELDTRFEEGTPPFLEGQQIAEAAVAVRVALSERIALAALLERQRADLESRVAERTGELQAALAVAQSSEAAKTAFLANMSHEIRTPLNGVIGVAETLRRSPLAPDQAAMVDLIVSSGAALQRLLGDVLDLSRVESGELTLAYSTFDLRKTVESAAGLFRISAENKGLEFTIAYGPGAEGFIETDEARLRQILVNLTANAVKFTERGSVTIEVDVQGDGDQAQLVFRVTDTGIGFDPSRTDALFSRFVQADVSITRKYGGTGLGLALSKAIADRLGGDIQAQSRLGQGSTFTLILPCLKKPTPPALTAPEVATGAPSLDGAKLRVLVAEDNLANQRVIKLLLDPLGVDVTITNNGQEALEAFTAQDFDIVLMDMQMPVMDGLTASRAVRALEAQRGRVPTPILMLTANGTPEHIAQARAAGCDDYLVKPITPKILAEAITRALDR
jgi:signal transduction histidine kinase/ActR/RegA family two-component response regulator